MGVRPASSVVRAHNSRRSIIDTQTWEKPNSWTERFNSEDRKDGCRGPTVAAVLNRLPRVVPRAVVYLVQAFPRPFSHAFLTLQTNRGACIHVVLDQDTRTFAAIHPHSSEPFTGFFLPCGAHRFSFPSSPSIMTLSLERTNDAIHFRGTNGSFDLPIASSGDQEGLSPMEMAALSVVGCSSIDILTILNKQKQEIDDFSAQIDGERADDPPRVFTDLHMHYELAGNVDPDKVRRAIELSLDKYCSVSNMVDQTATVTYAFTVNGDQYQQETRS